MLALAHVCYKTKQGITNAKHKYEIFIVINYYCRVLQSYGTISANTVCVCSPGDLVVLQFSLSRVNDTRYNTQIGENVRQKQQLKQITITVSLSALFSIQLEQAVIPQDRN